MRTSSFRLTKVIIGRPFKELDHRYQLRLQPAASLHVFGGQASPHLPLPDSGRFRNGHLEIDRPSKFENTVRREAGASTDWHSLTAAGGPERPSTRSGARGSALLPAAPRPP